MLDLERKRAVFEQSKGPSVPTEETSSSVVGRGAVSLSRPLVPRPHKTLSCRDSVAMVLPPADSATATKGKRGGGVRLNWNSLAKDKHVKGSSPIGGPLIVCLPKNKKAPSVGDGAVIL